MRNNQALRPFFLAVLSVLLSATFASAQTTAFTYQGKLTDAGSPASGNYDLQFKLFDALNGGTQVGLTITNPTVQAMNGIFTVTLDFGVAAFPGADRFLEINLRPAGSIGGYQQLLPRQKVMSTPYALQSLNATNAASATTAVNFSGTLAGDMTGTQSATAIANNAVTTAKLADGGVTDAKIAGVAGGKITGSITTATLPGANVTGTVANAATAVNFSGTLAGDVTGTQSATAIANNAVTTAKLADASVTDAKIAGVAGSKITGSITTATVPGANVTGTVANATTSVNFSGTLVGDVAGTQSATSIANNAVTTAKLADGNVTDAKIATVAGSKITGSVPVASIPAGSANYIQNQNAAPQAATNFNISGNGTLGGALTAGTLSGNGASLTNLNAANIATGTLTTARGGTGLGSAGAAGNYLRSDGTNWASSALQAADLPAGNANYIQNGTAQQTSSNFNISGTGTLGGNLIANGRVGLGTANPLRALQIGANVNALLTVEATDGTPNAGYIRFGDNTGWKLHFARNRESSAGALNSGTTGAVLTIQDQGNVGIGTATPANRLDIHTSVSGDGINLFGPTPTIYLGGQSSVTGGVLAYDTDGLFSTSANSGQDVVLRSNGGAMILQSGSGGAGLFIGPTNAVLIPNLGVGSTQLCRSSLNVISNCSSSLRYKTDIASFAHGLDVIQRLRPITFKWKQDGTPDVGFGAEEVAAVEPLFTFKNNKGEIEGVKYNQLSAVFVNAFKEQQAQIEALRRANADLNARQRAQLETLRKEQLEQLATLRQANAALEARLRAIEQRLRHRQPRRTAH